MMTTLKSTKAVNDSKLTREDASKLNYAYARLKATGENPNQDFMKRMRRMINLFL